MTKARVNADNASADIQGVTAGTGLSGGGTSGTVTLTNDMATTIDAKGDLIVGTADNTYVRQAVGSNNQVLMADSAQADGVKWANEATATLTTTGDILYASAANTLARRAIGSTGDVLTVSGGVPTWAAPSSGSMTVISSGTLSGSSLSLTSIPSTYNDLRLVIRNYDPSADQSSIFLNFNNDTTANRYKDVTNLMSTDNTQNFGDNRLLVGTQGNDDTINQNLTILTVGDYANSTTWKFIAYDYLANNYVTTANLNYANRRGYYNQTAAISSIQLTTVSQATGTPGTFSGGTYILYGVK